MPLDEKAAAEVEAIKIKSRGVGEYGVLAEKMLKDDDVVKLVTESQDRRAARNAFEEENGFDAHKAANDPAYVEDNNVSKGLVAKAREIYPQGVNDSTLFVSLGKIAKEKYNTPLSGGGKTIIQNSLDKAVKAQREEREPDVKAIINEEYNAVQDRKQSNPHQSPALPSPIRNQSNGGRMA